MAKIKTTTILFALMAALWAAPSANAGTPLPAGSIHLAQMRCPNPVCRKWMTWKWIQINGVWVKRYYCPEFTCN